MHPGPASYHMYEGGEGGLRVPTSDPHATNACWSLFLLFTYLVVAEAASFDKKELCRSDTIPLLSKGGQPGQGEQQMDAPCGKRVAKKKPTMVLVITLLVIPICCAKKTQQKYVDLI